MFLGVIQQEYLWYSRSDSNRHALRHLILSQECLPIPPRERYCTYSTLTLKRPSGNGRIVAPSKRQAVYRN